MSIKTLSIDSLKTLFAKHKKKTDEEYVRVSRNATVYVAPDGSDTTGDGTEEKPFATIQKAVDYLDSAAYDCTIRLKAGIYNFTIKDSCLAYITKIRGRLNIAGEGTESTILNITGRNYSGDNIVFWLEKTLFDISNMTLNYTPVDGKNYVFYSRLYGTNTMISYVYVNILDVISTYVFCCYFWANTYLSDNRVACTKQNTLGRAVEVYRGDTTVLKTIPVPNNMYGIQYGNAVHGGIGIRKSKYVDWGAWSVEDSTWDAENNFGSGVIQSY